MSSTKPLFRIQFISNGERYELFVREVCQGNMFGFIEIGDFVWDSHTSLVLEGSSKITQLSDKVMAFPTPIYTPKNSPK